MINGILVVNKPTDMTSRDVVNHLNFVFHTKKIGHTGTLDPLATGVLVITIGNYTKLVNTLTSLDKEYIAEIKLGVKTDTGDITGNVLEEDYNYNLTADDILKVFSEFPDFYEQTVPKYSAIKINGKKLYEYARNNIDIELPKREVDIKEIEVLEINNNIIKFRCLVSKGTYIRSLIRDIGESLNTGAIMLNLRRTKQGVFDIKDSYTLEDIKNNKYKLLTIEDIFDLDIIECDDTLYKQISSGVKQEYKKEYTLYKYNGNNMALYKDGKMFIFFNN